MLSSQNLLAASWGREETRLDAEEVSSPSKCLDCLKACVLGYFAVFSVPMIKHSDKSKLRGKGFVLALSSKVALLHGHEVKQQELETGGHMVSKVRWSHGVQGQVESQEWMFSAHFPLFMLVKVLAQGMVPLTVVGFLTSIHGIKITPHRLIV